MSVLTSICTPLVKITIEAGDYTRINTPIEVALDGVPIGFVGDFYRLIEVKGTEQIETIKWF